MFGYIVGNQTAMREEELKRYRSFYCGLCRELGERHGQASKLSLTYDMTFLIILLSSLYEPEENPSAFRCIVHPAKRQAAMRNRYTEYAADLSVALTYFKCLDDWKDEKKQLRRLYAKTLEGSYRGVREKWPRQCAAIERALTQLGRLEQTPDALLDDLARAFGTMMGELFVCQEDHWSDTLRAFGDYLGRFIYVMDAAMEEIKKAYRQKAKQYHPDLHPNDAEAARKMNEVNEAYDMLTNPGKYAQRTQQQTRSSSQQSSSYGQQENPYGRYQGPGGWASDFDFDFDDIFGFGFGGDFTGAQPHRPQAESGDSAAIRQVIDDINSHQSAGDPAAVPGPLRRPVLLLFLQMLIEQKGVLNDEQGDRN